eukprot:3289926-Prymnesium_polylepis.1
MWPSGGPPARTPPSCCPSLPVVLRLSPHDACFVRKRVADGWHSTGGGAVAEWQVTSTKPLAVRKATHDSSELVAELPPAAIVTIFAEVVQPDGSCRGRTCAPRLFALARRADSRSLCTGALTHSRTRAHPRTLALSHARAPCGRTRPAEWAGPLGPRAR